MLRVRGFGNMRRQHSMAKHHCRLRKHRKSARLSQRELAALVGLKSQGALSDIETGIKCPTLPLAFACAAAFGVAPEELFPGLFEQAGAAFLQRVERLNAQRVDGSVSQTLGLFIDRLSPAQR